MFLSDKLKPSKFKFRFPSMRKNTSSSATATSDIENPPETVPLQRLSPTTVEDHVQHNQQLSPDALLPDKRPLDREMSNLSTLTNEDFRTGSRSSQGSLRRASSLEHIKSTRSPARSRLKSVCSGNNFC